MYQIFAFRFWLTQPPTQCPVPTCPPTFFLSRLAECLCSLPTAVVNLCMPRVHTLANKPFGGLVQWKHVRSTTQPAWTETPTREWVGHLGQIRRPRWTTSHVPTSVQKHESASKHGSLESGRAVGPLPLSQMLSETLPQPAMGRGDGKWARRGTRSANAD